MAEITEKRFQDRVMKKLRTLRGTWWFKVQGAVGGVPDVIGCVRGVFIALELKRSPRAKMTKLQEYTHDTIRGTAEGVVYVVHPDNWEEVFEEIKLISRARKWR